MRLSGCFWELKNLEEIELLVVGSLEVAWLEFMVDGRVPRSTGAKKSGRYDTIPAAHTSNDW